MHIFRSSKFRVLYPSYSRIPVNLCIQYTKSQPRLKLSRIYQIFARTQARTIAEEKCLAARKFNLHKLAAFIAEMMRIDTV